MNYETINYEVEDHIATVTLNRPEKLNVINYKMYQEIMDTCHRIDLDADIRVMIIRGAGKSFCAGHDVSEMFSPYASKESTKDISGKIDIYPESTIGLANYEMHKYIKPRQILRDLRVPTIAQIHGWCLLGGWVLANECDLIVASEDVKIAHYAAKLGQVPTESFPDPWYMPWRKLKEFYFTGMTITAAEAYRLGMVNRIAPLEKLDEETRKLAGEIAAMHPGGIQLTKQVLNMIQNIQGFQAVQEAGLGWHWLTHHADWHMGKGGFREKYTKKGVKKFISEIGEKRTETR